MAQEDSTTRGGAGTAGAPVAVPEGPFLVVGLGNPGPGYAGNRHNVGVMVLEELASRAGIRLAPGKGARARALSGEGRLAGRRVVLARPTTYMNESGGPVASLRDFFKVPTDRIVVVHDELEIPYGWLRLKAGGGDAGHNGLKSISACLGSKDYVRVRVGIGRPPGRMDVASYVLKDFSGTERKELPFHLDRAADAVEGVLATGLELAQNAFNAPPV